MDSENGSDEGDKLLDPVTVPIAAAEIGAKPVVTEEQTQLAPFPRFLSLFSSVVFGVGIVLVNKLFIPGFPFPITILFVHAGAGWGALWAVGKWCRAWPTPTAGPSQAYLWTLGLGVMLNHIATLTSLQVSTVGTYQMFKLTVIPLVLGLEWKDKASVATVSSIVVLLLGVVRATVSDVQLTPASVFWGTLGALLAAYTTFRQGKMCRQWGLDPVYAEYLLSPPKSILGFCLLLLFERCSLRPPDSELTWGLFICSTILAVAMNVVNMIIMGKISVLTYQITGQAKTVFILLGWMILDRFNGLNVLQLVGICTAVAGTFLYSWPLKTVGANLFMVILFIVVIVTATVLF